MIIIWEVSLPKQRRSQAICRMYALKRSPDPHSYLNTLGEVDAGKAVNISGLLWGRIWCMRRAGSGRVQTRIHSSCPRPTASLHGQHWQVLCPKPEILLHVHWQNPFHILSWNDKKENRTPSVINHKKVRVSRFLWRNVLLNTHCSALKWNACLQKTRTQFAYNCATFLLEVISDWRDHMYCIRVLTLIKWIMVSVREKPAHLETIMALRLPIL